uniref:Uncharacterized protein n=1 Tax=Arundo donax TaxID=35708 RepID=A0A0A8Z9F7_ARUDO
MISQALEKKSCLKSANINTSIVSLFKGHLSFVHP